MTYSEILYDVSDWIATITLNRPDKLNAWTFTMEREYRHAMADAETRNDVRVIVVTGAGRGFCAGADISLLSGVLGNDVSPADVTVPDTQPGQGKNTRPDFRKPHAFPPAIHKPVLGAINGVAVGIGLVHTLYYDIRFAADTAKIGTAFVQRGLIAEYGMAWLLPRLVGLENAMDLLFSGRMITAEEAQRMGLLSRVVPADALMATVREYATLLATRCSPRSIAIMKQQVYEAQFSSLGESIDLATTEMMASFGTDDFREGVQSYLEKRPPVFTGK